jgi:type IV pilus assembly protein PilM
VVPGLKVPNVVDSHALNAALESALADVGVKSGAVTLVVPDAAARVLLLDFDTLPGKRNEALSVVRFRLRKMVPFDVEGAAVSYQVMAERKGQLNVLVTVMPGDVLEEYETAVRDAGYEAGAVLPSTLAAAASVEGDGATLMVNRAGASVTTATVLAWYEDTLKRLPSTMYYAGPGGASAAAESRWASLVEPAPRIVDPGVAELSAITSIPAGLTAGVAGALAT